MCRREDVFVYSFIMHSRLHMVVLVLHSAPSSFSAIILLTAGSANGLDLSADSSDGVDIDASFVTIS